MTKQHTTPLDTRPMSETFLEYIGDTLTIQEMADKYGVNRDYLEGILKYGAARILFAYADKLDN
jgi:uncharacterized protein (DUF433 family)